MVSWVTQLRGRGPGDGSAVQRRPGNHGRHRGVGRAVRDRADVLHQGRRRLRLDEAAEVIERALAALATGTRVAGEVAPLLIATDRDLLADLDDVLANDRVPAG